MTGLHKLTAVANTLQAREDWARLAAKALQAGMSAEDIQPLAPDADDGWRKIDKCIVTLRERLRQFDSYAHQH